MILLDGKLESKKILNELKEKMQNISKKGCLAVIEVADNETSSIYVRSKARMAKELGIAFKHIKLNVTIEEKELLTIIERLNNDEEITGIIVQLPLPSHLNSCVIKNKILPEKDIDGLTSVNIGKLISGEKGFISPTAKGIIDLLKKYHIPMKGKCATIITRSDLVGKPLTNLFLNEDATVIVCHSKTKDLKIYTQMADILVVAVGKAKTIDADYIKKDAIVIDVGINKLADGTICGDVDFENVKNKTSYITPVPGGVGPMTIAEIGLNIYEAILKSKEVS